MVNIYFVRHGQTDYNKNGRFQGTTDVDLNSLGLKQADQIGKRLQSKRIDIIYASHLKRVTQTAVVISKYTSANITTREELREIDMGAWECLNFEQVNSQYAGYYEEWSKHIEDMPYPGGECGADVEKRAMKVVEEIINQGYEESVIVTSGGTIRVLLSRFMGLNLENRFLIDTDNCGLSIVRYDKQSRKYYIKCINDTSHLEKGY